MLEINNIDRFRTAINRLEIKVKADKGLYNQRLYEHLFGLLKFHLLPGGNSSNFKKFDLTQYYGLVQFALENSALVEKETQHEIDWKFINDAKDIIRNKFRTLLGRWFVKDTRFGPMLDFTIDTMGYDLVYKMMHPETDANPWYGCEKIFEDGYLFLGTDDEDQQKTYRKDMFVNVEDAYRHNLGFIAFSKTEKNEAKSFSGFVVDNRLSLQQQVLTYIKEHAHGVTHSKKKSQILSYFNDRNADTFRLPVIFQNLKKLGMMGSTNQGFFFMESAADYQASYDFHKVLINGHKATVRALVDAASSNRIVLDGERFAS